MGYIDPKVVFALHDISIVTIMVVMVGGVATYWGPAVGAVIMVLLAEIIRSIPKLGTAHQTFFGILLIVIIIFLPNGIVGDFSKLKRMVGMKKSLAWLSGDFMGFSGSKKCIALLRRAGSNQGRFLRA